MRNHSVELSKLYRRITVKALLGKRRYRRLLSNFDYFYQGFLLLRQTIPVSIFLRLRLLGSYLLAVTRRLSYLTQSKVTLRESRRPVSLRASRRPCLLSYQRISDKARLYPAQSSRLESARYRLRAIPGYLLGGD